MVSVDIGEVEWTGSDIGRDWNGDRVWKGFAFSVRWRVGSTGVEVLKRVLMKGPFRSFAFDRQSCCGRIGP